MASAHVSANVFGAVTLAKGTLYHACYAQAAVRFSSLGFRSPCKTRGSSLFVGSPRFFRAIVVGTSLATSIRRALPVIASNVQIVFVNHSMFPFASLDSILYLK
eukprot:6064365-Pyramimonas_sp.AAC.1